MKNTIFFFFLIIQSLVIIESKAQNTLVLVNGKKIEISEFKQRDSLFLSYKNKKGKIKLANLLDVFSVQKEDGKEIIYYVADSTNNESFTVNQMRNFVNGSYDARTNYKTPWITSAGFVVGGSSAIAVSSVGLNSVLAPVFPALYSGAIGIIKVKKEKLNIPENLRKNEYYTEGYYRTANHKRINNAIFSSGVGMAIGIVALLIFAK